MLIRRLKGILPAEDIYAEAKVINEERAAEAEAAAFADEKETEAVTE